MTTLAILGPETELTAAAPEGARLDDLEAVYRFVTAGHAIFTLRSKRSGTRFTFKVTKAEPREGADPERAPWFVALLTGPENTADYTYLGCLWPRFPAGSAATIDYAHGKKSRIGKGAPSEAAAAWFFRLLGARSPNLLTQTEVWHLGRCGRCGRPLTVPESIASGIGPVCEGRE